MNFCSLRPPKVLPLRDLSQNAESLAGFLVELTPTLGVYSRLLRFGFCCIWENHRYEDSWDRPRVADLQRGCSTLFMTERPTCNRTVSGSWCKYWPRHHINIDVIRGELSALIPACRMGSANRAFPFAIGVRAAVSEFPVPAESVLRAELAASSKLVGAQRMIETCSR